jgi:cell division protein FtsZ
MANVKRASMREGPLAALFRKTDEASEESAPPPPPERSRESGPPHPALNAPTETREQQDAREEPAEIPTPRERLRHAFSSEIPENVMDPPSARPVMDSYTREHPAGSSFGAGEAGDVEQPVIRVVGVGGAGVNAVNRMVEAEVEGVEFLAVNTDLQSLQQSTADITLHIGAELTKGLGSGSDANVGRGAAMEDYDRVKALLKGSDMIFITAGAGGGTGTGAAPVLARISREVGALTVAIVTKPFGFEGSRRAEQAEHGVGALAEEVDTLIVVPNNRLLDVLDKQTAMVEAFRVADDVLRQGVQGISDLVTLPGLINLDFADVRTIMSDAGNALLGIGMGVGENRATDAAMQAVSSPLLETSMEGAHSILLSITGGNNLSLWEVNEAAKSVSEAAHPDANIIFGAMVDEKLDDQVWVTVVATGYGDRGARRRVGRMQEPAGELTVQRSGKPGAARRGSPPGGQRRGGLAVDELEVPEFIPNL